MRTRFAIRVQPGARRAGLVGRMGDGTLKVAVTAPPEGGRANAAVVVVVAEALGLRPRQVRVAAGAASRAKVLEVEGLDADTVRQRLDAAVAGATQARRQDGQ